MNVLASLSFPDKHRLIDGKQGSINWIYGTTRKMN